MNQTWTGSIINQTARRLAAGAALALVIACTAIAHAAPPATAAESLPAAPDDTAEVWVDLESEAAREHVTAIGVSQDATNWNDQTPAGHSFGASVRAGATPGPVDIRVRTDAALVADVAVTFVDADGTVLDTALLRSVALAPPTGGASWTRWADMVAGSGSIPGNDTGTDDSNNDGTTPDSQGSNPALTRTGADGAALPALIALGALATGAGAAALILGRRTTHRQGAAK